MIEPLTTSQINLRLLGFDWLMIYWRGNCVQYIFLTRGPEFDIPGNTVCMFDEKLVSPL